MQYGNQSFAAAAQPVVGGPWGGVGSVQFAPQGGGMSWPPVTGRSSGSGPVPPPPAPAQPRPDVGPRVQAAIAAGDELEARGLREQALERFRAAVQLDPGDAGAHGKLGVCAGRLGQFALSEHHLRECVRLAPMSHRAHELLSTVYREQGKTQPALTTAARAVELDPTDVGSAVALGSALFLAGRYEDAEAAIDPFVAAGPRGAGRSGQLGALFGRLAPRLKREGEALAFIAGLLAADPPGQPSPGAMTAADRAALHLTAASLLDAAGRYDEAFEQARLGHAADRPAYDPADFSRWVDFQGTYFTPRKLHDLPRASHRSRRPVFIVGMPRSGTTLVEQVLACHPQVYGAGELDALSKVSLAGRQGAGVLPHEIYPGWLDSLSVRKANELAGGYLGRLAALDAAATHVTDKMPGNFVYLGLIALLFPDCHIIHCTRDPVDTCLSCYMTFGSDQAYAGDLAHLGARYRDYRRLMAHWKSVLNCPMIEVSYEAMVADQEGEARRLLGLLGLPWDDRCLRFHANTRPVLTASLDQVRRPIYASSVGRWRHYEKHLGPLIEALG